MSDVDRFDPRPLADLPCNVFVARVTDYLEGALDAEQVAIVEAHLEGCEGCTTVLEQWRTVIAMVGRLAERQVDEIDPQVRIALLDAFRRMTPS